MTTGVVIPVARGFALSYVDFLGAPPVILQDPEVHLLLSSGL